MLQDSEQSLLKKQYLNLNETVSSLKSLNASLEESITSREQEMTKMEAMVAKFKEEREEIISQVSLLSYCHLPSDISVLNLNTAKELTSL